MFVRFVFVGTLLRCVDGSGGGKNIFRGNTVSATRTPSIDLNTLIAHETFYFLVL